MNDSNRWSFWNRLKDSLNRLSQSQWCFFLALNALRSLVWPYAGITHDAMLYALQVMNRATGGFFHQDPFFLHGSQDDYSIFSILLAPLAAKLGLSSSFFLVYLASTALLIFAEIRLVRRLVPDRLAANVALVLLVVTDLPWGGWGVFHVHEPFLTARLPAVALTLLGLEQLLRRRFLIAFVLLLAAAAVHPLMAVGGLLVAAAFLCVAKLPFKAVLAIALTAALSAALVLLYQPLGAKLLGYMDPQWYDIVRRRNPYSFPSAWWATDWWRIAYSLGILGFASKHLDRDCTIVARLVIVLALAGVVGSVVMEASPYALLLQGQPYRGLWLLEFLAVPLGVLVMFRLCKMRTLAADLGAIFVLLWTGRLFPEKDLACESLVLRWTMALSLFIFFAFVFYRTRSAEPRSTAAGRGWLSPAVLATLTATAGCLSLTNVLTVWRVEWAETAPLWLVSLIPWVCSHAILAFVGIVAIAALWSATKDVRKAGFAAAAAWAGLSAAAFFWPNDLRYWYPSAQDRADIGFVRQFVNQHRKDQGPAPVIYWPTEPTHVWFGIPANCFYCWTQSAGVVFSRGTAIESQRRALLVRRFEIPNLRATCDVQVFRNYYSPFFQADIDEPGPNKQDLIRLCKEQELGFVVLRRAFRDLVAATNGRVFVYDCRLVRGEEPDWGLGIGDWGI